MLAYIPYMDPMGDRLNQQRAARDKQLDTMMDFRRISAPCMASNSHLQNPRQMM